MASVDNRHLPCRGTTKRRTWRSAGFAAVRTMILDPDSGALLPAAMAVEPDCRSPDAASACRDQEIGANCDRTGRYRGECRVISHFSKTNVGLRQGDIQWLSAFACFLAAQRSPSLSSTAFATCR